MRFFPECLHELAHREERRYGDKEMHVILGDRPLDDLYVVGLAYLSYRSLSRSATCPYRTFLRYFVIHTRWYLRSYTA